MEPAHSSDIVRNEPHHIQRAPLDVFGVIRDGVYKLAHVYRQSERGAQLDQTLRVDRANRIFEPGVIKFIQQTPHGHGLLAVIGLNGIVHQHKFVAHRLANFPDFLHVPDIGGNRRPGGMLPLPGMYFVALVAERFRLQHVRHVIFHGGQMLGTRIGHQAILCAPAHNFVNRLVHRLAQNIPEADISRRGVGVRPGACLRASRCRRPEPCSGPSAELAKRCVRKPQRPGAGRGRGPPNPPTLFIPEVAVSVGSSSSTFLPVRLGFAHASQFSVRLRLPSV